MVEELRQGQGVVGNPGHEIPHSVVVVVGEGQLLAVAEHLVPHVPLDLGPQVVALVVRVVAAQGLENHQGDHPGAGEEHLLQGVRPAAAQQGAGDVPHPQGQHQGDGRFAERAQQVQGEHQPVGPVKRNEFFRVF